MSLCPITHWRHGSPARPRELTPDEKRERLAELKASRVRVAMRHALKPLRDVSEAFFRALFGMAEPLPSRANMRGYDIYDFERGTQLAAEDVRVTDETEATRA